LFQVFFSFFYSKRTENRQNKTLRLDLKQMPAPAYTQFKAMCFSVQLQYQCTPRIFHQNRKMN